MKRLLCCFIAAAALATGCATDGDDDGFDDVSATTAPLPPTDPPTATPAPTTPAPTPTEKPKADECVDNTKTEGQADLEMLDFEFAPSCLIIATTQGLRLHNEGKVEHNFSVKKYEGLNVDLEPGDENNTERTGLKPGTYEFFCRFHEKTEDMKGELRIKKVD